MSRTDFHLNAAWLGTQVGETSGDETPAGEPPADKRFAWDTFWGGSIDFIDYVNGRIGIVIDYEAVLGREFQLFDPNQGNYTLEASSSARIDDDNEVVALFHHVSRHLSDRTKARNPVRVAVRSVICAGGTRSPRLIEATFDTSLMFPASSVVRNAM